MKKKLLTLLLLTVASTLTLAGCSFLSDITNNIPSDNSSGNNGSNDNTDVWSVRPESIEVLNKTTAFQIDDLFTMPSVFITDVKGNKREVTDKAKVEGLDLSKENPSLPIKIVYPYIYKESDIKTVKGNFSYSYNIKVTRRRDTHMDPSEDENIKTLQIAEVTSHFNMGGQFVKPKVYAIKHDDTRTEVTDSCVFSGYDLSWYGYQNVSVSYNDHILTYEIVVHNKEEESHYPYSHFDYRLNVQNPWYVVGQQGELYFMKLQDDGTYACYGKGFDSYLQGMNYSSSDESVVTIDQNGVILAKKAGTAFLYVSGQNLEFRSKIVVEDKDIQSIDVNSYRYKYYSGQPVVFSGDVTVTYQNGYSESVIPTIDLSKVNIDVPAIYQITLSYTVNGKTVSTTKDIDIVDSSTYVLEKVVMEHNITEYDYNFIASALPLSGTVKNLVVPVKFTDSNKYITNYENVREDIEKCFFGENEDVGWRSVKTYYEEESFNAIEYTGIVTEVYEDSRPSTDYYDSTNSCDLKNNIVDWYFENHPEDNIKNYDANHDGYIDGLNLIYLVPDAWTSGVGRDVAPNLWAMVKSQRDELPNVEKPVSDKYLWASYDFIYPTREIALARTEKTNYSEPSKATGNNNRDGILLEPRTFIHETGHMFGINDYYSYTEDDVYFAGDKNMQTSNVMGHDPYSLLLYNWADPYIPEISMTINIGDFQKTHDVILLTPEWNSANSPFDEYFLIDLYVPESGLNAFDSGRYPEDKGFNTMGVRIWHVDARLATSTTNYSTFTFDPTVRGATFITDNSYGEANLDDNLKQYDRFMELQLVRNVADYDYSTAGKLEAGQYFLPGDTFDMASFSSQFVNGSKMDNGKDFGWSIRVDGIYNSANGYTADITVTKI